MENQLDADAMCDRGYSLYEQGKNGEAEQWLRKAASAGHADAMLGLAVVLLEQGKNGEAEQWARKGAATGGTDAMAGLGVVLYLQGKYDEAEQWLRKGAATEDPFTMNVLGRCLLEQGSKTHSEFKRDRDEAEQWFRKAAVGGDADAMHNLGLLMFVKGNLAEAWRWRRKRAAAGMRMQPTFRHKGSGLHQSWFLGWEWNTGGGSARAYVTEKGEEAAELAEIARQMHDLGPH
jgi:TPR repeat protein